MPEHRQALLPTNTIRGYTAPLILDSMALQAHTSFAFEIQSNLDPYPGQERTYPQVSREETMNKKRILLPLLILCTLLLGLSLYAQINRPFHHGSVFAVSFIQVKPGMDVAYLNYLTTDWKKEQEALKAAGITLSYKVLTTEGHSSTDWNLMLLTEYKDMATLEASEKKADTLGQKVVGTDEKQMQGYKDRLAIREVMGTRLAREVILSPEM